MFSRYNPPTALSSLPTKRLALLLVVAIVAIVAASSGVVIAEGSESNNESAVIHEFAESDAKLTNVEFDDDTAYVTITVDGPGGESVAVSDAGFSGQGQFAMTTARVIGEETIEIGLRGDEAVAVTTSQDAYQYHGDVGVLTILQSQPTVQIVQWAVISGAIGPVFALAIVVTSLRRQHENTYKELTSEERIKVEKDPVDGFVDKVKRFVAENKTLVLSSALLMAYFMAWWFGRAPGPIEFWASLSDAMRVIVVGAFVAFVLMLVPVYVLAARLWSPDKEFVLSADARDVIEEALGSNGGLAEMVEAIQEGDGLEGGDDRDDLGGGNYGVAIYSGSPDRISEMDVDGAATDTSAPGGRLHVVEAFDPSKNEARGTWPGLADDFELISERSKIDGNREILRDESNMLRSILSAMPAISIASDTGSARAVDKELRHIMTVDENPVDGILARAASGTRFEGFYGGEDGEEVEYQDPEEQDDDQPEKQDADS
ncbi:hypothetical protein [Natrarchaeobaculum sulfurireducens]|uniref:Uncharacterized protein n=1 Tax=Natrarchaeobaculum sulfurireducens TaxID=2044521 RepID=A0A346PQB5_9EURY|nr:hypothetical protein [Natrarchaeobaculum sulfurireducens]AXR81710.1 hypothetical protein AArcMg_1700 [Natrarchaeobaculum sulfurireducens]